jgi:hypothetical protein
MNLANSGDTQVFGAALTEGIYLRKIFDSKVLEPVV